MVLEMCNQPLQVAVTHLITKILNFMKMKCVVWEYLKVYLLLSMCNVQSNCQMYNLFLR